MHLDRLIAALEPAEVVNPAAREIGDLAYDSRAVREGTLFFCVPGATRDGHDLAPDAVAAGAVALVVERVLDLPVPQVRVPSVRRAMAAAAVAFFGDPSHELEIAAVTGTNGKTTTAFLLASILDAAGLRPGLLTNIERRVGGERHDLGLNTPEAIDLQRLLRGMLDAGDRSCAMEATSIAAEMGRLEGTRFAVLVFTNLTQDHLDFHQTMERYFRSKRELFAQADRAVVNVGDEWGRRLARELPGGVRTFTPDDDLGGIEPRLKGRFNRANVLGAVWAARELGIGDEAIRMGVESLAGVPGRFESVEAGQPFAVIVDYAHTPDSLENVLRAARELGGRLTVVFGAGGDRDREKRPLMGRVARSLADRAIVTTDNPRSEDPAAIAEQVSEGTLEVVLDRRRAIEQALADARAGDVVVIAGKGADTEMELADRRIPFDDREVAREVLS